MKDLNKSVIEIDARSVGGRSNESTVLWRIDNMIDKKWKQDLDRDRLVLYINGEEKIWISRISELWGYFERVRFCTLEVLKKQAEMIVCMD